MIYSAFKIKYVLARPNLSASIVVLNPKNDPRALTKNIIAYSVWLMLNSSFIFLEFKGKITTPVYYTKHEIAQEKINRIFYTPIFKVFSTSLRSCT